ncbi:threonine aldolase family protein [Hoeflea prorocentri]|uniref:L-threonine aldolase n=1 Tax=Hoeflea prorocentri TaxID=1922333 RepID=A0A9X3ZFY2_9HYPH|nr:low specificity L-threonine aldolase [Hoeflea prorocentri]MCY6379245.1 low specificity L-threonine aldolase [Hoeflea prorocentri]MDA5397046.1 low specificity L-threonine aldolase [Hoeflea prorocentri]
MQFSSDNWAGAHPRIAEALTRHADGFAQAYGLSEQDRKVEQRFGELFERDVAVFFVGTGTAANSISMAAANRPGGVAFAHREAHLIEDEGGAPQMLTPGARIEPVDGDHGRLDPEELDAAIRRFPAQFIHAGQPMAVSISQSTEIGTVYEAAQVDEISEICRLHGLPLHMDGARFANAMAALGQSPAEMTWKRGVDILSFGGTKNGCWCAEAIVVFNPDLARDLPFLRKRSAHIFSKSRFMAAQFEAYFEDDLWVTLASHANTMAKELQTAIAESQHARLAWESPANEVFAIMDRSTFDRLQAAGAGFYEWKTPHFAKQLIGENELITRLVTGFATTRDHVREFAALLDQDSPANL